MLEKQTIKQELLDKINLIETNKNFKLITERYYNSREYDEPKINYHEIKTFIENTNSSYLLKDFWKSTQYDSKKPYQSVWIWLVLYEEIIIEIKWYDDLIFPSGCMSFKYLENINENLLNNTRNKFILFFSGEGWFKYSPNIVNE